MLLRNPCTFDKPMAMDPCIPECSLARGEAARLLSPRSTRPLISRNQHQRQTCSPKPCFAAPQPAVEVAPQEHRSASNGSIAGPGTTPNARPSAKPSQASNQGAYPWTKQWYPVAVEAALDPAVPHKVTLMGYELVVWKDPKSGNWACFDNACPHRAAPLSQGRIDTSTGCLCCSYHGWEFNDQGKCTDIPQSSSPVKLCSIKATAAKSHPVQLRQGLVWMWAESGPQAAAEAAATPPVLAPQLDDPGWKSDFGWIWREVKVSWDWAVENSLDIAHAPFAHDGCLGVQQKHARQDGALTVVRNEPTWGVELVNDPPATQGLLSAFRQTHTFQAPGLFHVLNDQGKGPMAGLEIKLVVYRTPVTAGTCYVFYNNITRGGSPQLRAQLAAGKKKPLLETHLQMLRFFDADLVIMHEQERLIQQKGGWRSAYCMPHHTDAGVLAFRRWVDAAGPVPYKDGQTLGPVLPRHEVLEHYHSHVLRCPDCQQGLAELHKKQRAALLGGIILAFSSLALAARAALAVVLANTPTVGTVAKAAATAVGISSSGPGSTFTQALYNNLAAAASGAGPWWWLLPGSAVILAAAAAWLYSHVYHQSKQWEQDNVYFRDYDLRYGPDYRSVLPAVP